MRTDRPKKSAHSRVVLSLLHLLPNAWKFLWQPAYLTRALTGHYGVDKAYVALSLLIPAASAGGAASRSPRAAFRQAAQLYSRFTALPNKRPHKRGSETPSRTTPASESAAGAGGPVWGPGRAPRAEGPSPGPPRPGPGSQRGRPPAEATGRPLELPATGAR